MMRDRTVSGPSMCADAEADGAPLRRPHRIITPAVDLETASPSFIERVLGLNQFRAMLDDPARAFMSTTLLVGGSHVDDIAFELYSGSLEQQHRHGLHRDHLLHVKSATPVNIAIGDITGERVMRPLLRLDGNNIGMRHQQERGR